MSLPRRILLTLAVSLTAAGLTTCSRVTDATVDLVFSDAQEVKLGRQFKEEIESDSTTYPLYRNSPDAKQELIDYVDSLGELAAQNQSDRDSIDFSFTIVDVDTMINAFAVPGGFIYVYTGLLLNARNEAEIAGVLSHEVAHVAKRHGMKTLLKSYGYDFLLDILVGDSTKLRTVVDVGTGLAFLKYSRENEYEADSCAVEYLISSGVNPSGMKTFLELLAEQSGYSFEFLSTHPKTENRIERVTELIASKPSSVTELPVPQTKVSP